MLGMPTADRQLHERVVLGCSGERVLRVTPCAEAAEDHLAVVADCAQCLDDRVGDVVTVRRADHDHIDVVGEGAGPTVIPGCPGARDEGLFDAADVGEF